ncbi:MAG: formate--tetrahydrofolate ligase [Acetobacteraceae bacterium]|nr:formate--tetrahydrofolate ligase [Acetobacteraceae bacterium]
MAQKSDLEIARAATLQPIAEIAARAGVPDGALSPYGKTKAKVALDFCAQARSRPQGKLVLVSGISPTPAGEGKTTLTVGLADGLRRIGARAMVCLREPSLGPCFGMKGGAAGGGYAQVVPMEDINLHFTGDFHAITSAHNLLAAMTDNALHWGTVSGLDARRVSWHRVMDMNDRALRHTVIGLGGAAHGAPREDGFDITVASEVMAILCLATDHADLGERLARIVVAWRADGTPVTARDIKADGAMAVLLRDALSPNLVQTLEGTPAFVHGGPFANIAHGCNSVMATRTALGLSDIVITEAGFGADLGAEKFLDIKCRAAGIWPAATVVVATVRALKMHGGIARADLGTPNPAAVRAGCINLARHIENLGKFGQRVLVGLNGFVTDTDEEHQVVLEEARAAGAEAHLCTHWSDGGAGTESLAHAVREAVAGPVPKPAFLYPIDLGIPGKLETIARSIYRADGVDIAEAALRKLERWEKAGFTGLPVCIAKTQYSFSADPNLRGAPVGHRLPVRDVRLAAGAGFVVAIAGDIMTMPGLPKVPAAEFMHLDAVGGVVGLS